MIEYPFAYDRPSTSKDFIGRKIELAQFVKIITENKKGITLYSPVKTGKESFVRQGYKELKLAKFKFVACEIDLSYIKTLDGFDKLLRVQLSDLYNSAMANALLKFDLDIESMDIKSLISLPETIAVESNTTVIIYFKEFQNALSFASDSDLEKVEKILAEQKNVRYIFTGSFVNSMKYIFEDKKYFYYLTKKITLSNIARKDCCEYIASTMLSNGKIIETEEINAIVDAALCNIWYVKRICSICCSHMVGYVNSNVVQSSINSLLAVLSPQYLAIMHDLTPNQVNFLRAVVDEVPRFSSMEVLEKYKLVSSANVCRLKDAVKKKEIITFDNQDNASFVDPMFKYWLKTTYFKL